MVDNTSTATDATAFIKGVHGVRYQVKDVERSVAFYTRHLGFKLEHQQLPAFASVDMLSGRRTSNPAGGSGRQPARAVRTRAMKKGETQGHSAKRSNR